MKLNKDQFLYIWSMGKRLRVTAVFHDDDAANTYMAKHRNESVIAAFDPYVFLANHHDKGEKVV